MDTPGFLDDFEVAGATYRAAVARWPAARITLRQGIRVVLDVSLKQTAICIVDRTGQNCGRHCFRVCSLCGAGRTG
jgi:hypothetical protein